MVEIVSLKDVETGTGPRRVMKYILIWCSEGTLEITIDENDFELHTGELITITSGQIHYIKELKNVKGYWLTFTLDFFCKDDHDIELIFQNGLFCHFDRNEVIPVSDRTAMETQLELINKELNEKPYQYLISVHSRIELILIQINRAKVDRGDEIWKPDALFLRFLESVRTNFEHNYSLAQFATMLNTTELKLNEQAKLHAGKTAQNVIHGLVVSEAKRLLMYENLTIKEVATRLGFNDPFYFSNFFKKHATVSPKSYQQRYVI